MLKQLRLMTQSGIRISIPLHPYRTVICGESGEGKTLVFNTLQQYLSQGILGYPCCLIDNDKYRGNINFIGRKDALYVIDNADILLYTHDDLFNLVHSDEYQFLLMGHNFTNVRTDIRCFGRLSLHGTNLSYIPLEI